MAETVEDQVKKALQTFSQALVDLAELEVVTRFKTFGEGALGPAVLELKSVIKLDGDREGDVPVTVNADKSVSVNQEALDAHLRNVQSAVAARNATMTTLIDIFRKRGL